MVRKTPLPLLRDLAPEVLVVRCGHCCELVLFDELCKHPLEAACCPRRSMLERPEQVPIGPLALPLATLQGAPLDA
jgi:hypothetical protein